MKKTTNPQITPIPQMPKAVLTEDQQWERVGEPIPLRRPPVITAEQFDKAWRGMRKKELDFEGE